LESSYKKEEEEEEARSFLHAFRQTKNERLGQCVDDLQNLLLCFLTQISS
jgi:hypothetical protein